MRSTSIHPVKQPWTVPSVHLPVSSVVNNHENMVVLGGKSMATLYSVKGCKGEQVNVPSWPCNICSPFTSSASQGAEEGAASRHMALMPWQASGNLQVHFSLMLVLEISKVSGSTWSTSVKERLPKGHFIPIPPQPCKDAAVRQLCSSPSPVGGKGRV